MAINYIVERKQSQSLSRDEDGESRAPGPRRGHSPRDIWRAAAALSVVLPTVLFGRRTVNNLSQQLFPQHQGMFNLRSPTHVGCIDQPDLTPCCPPILPPELLDSYLALCLVLRDGANFPEWLAHHRRLGVGAFYMFDHGSLKALPDRIPDRNLMRGDAHYQYIDTLTQASDTCPQMTVYHECLRIGQQHPWMGFIDVDEFLVPAPRHVILLDFLAHIRKPLRAGCQLASVGFQQSYHASQKWPLGEIRGLRATPLLPSFVDKSHRRFEACTRLPLRP